MLDAAMIEKCADPSLKPAIVEQFVKAAGSPDPLAITVRSGNRIIPVPKPTTADEALTIIRENVAHSIVRVGVTQFPADLGAKEVGDLKPDLVDTCENLRMGTRMFAKVTPIVAKWYGNPKSDEVFPQIFEDAVFAWKSGEFEGTNVFLADDTAVDRNPPEVSAGTTPEEAGMSRRRTIMPKRQWKAPRRLRRPIMPTCALSSRELEVGNNRHSGATP
jgi:hypothetical protein